MKNHSSPVIFAIGCLLILAICASIAHGAQQPQKLPSDEQLQIISLRGQVQTLQAEMEILRRSDQKQIEALTAEVKRLNSQLDKKTP